MKAKLLNGLLVEGTPEELNTFIQLSQNHEQERMHNEVMKIPSQYYFSASHNEQVLIADMHTCHLRNALVKYFKDWSYVVHDKWDNELIKFLEFGCTDAEFHGLLHEYKKRLA